MNYPENRPLMPRRYREDGFTMVEIVLSLAVIAVAMVAIIGVLPLGMNVEAENRENSIVSADAAIWSDAISGGAQDVSYLLPFVQEVKVTQTRVQLATGAVLDQVTDYYTRGDFHSGSNLLSLVSQPKYRLVDVDGNGQIDPATDERLVREVYVDFRAMNGNMGDLIADDDFAFKYRVTPELVPKTPEFIANDQSAWVMQTNLYDLRLHFGWPLIVGPGGHYRDQTRFSRQLTFRTLVSGNQLVFTNELVNNDFLFFVNARGFQRELNTNATIGFPATPLP